MTCPRVAILVPTFRRPLLLGRLLRSALAQTYNDFGVYVYDNASGDATEAVVRKFMERDPRVLYRCNDRNLGPHRNFQRAFSEVESEFFCLVSDDDILLPRCLEMEVDGLETHRDARAWTGIVISCEEGGGGTSFKPDPTWPAGFADAEAACGRLSRGSRPETTGALFRRQVLGPAFLELRDDFWLSDVNWLLTAALAGGIGHTPEPTAIFLQHPQSVSTAAGKSAERAVSIYWPSVRHLVEAITTSNAFGKTMTERFVADFYETYGAAPLRHFGLEAVCSGDTALVLRIAEILESELGDIQGARRLKAMTAWPAWRTRSYRLMARGWDSVSNAPSRISSRITRRRLSRIAAAYQRQFAR